MYYDDKLSVIIIIKKNETVILKNFKIAKKSGNFAFDMEIRA